MGGEYCYVSLAGAQFDGHPTIQSPAASCYPLLGISHFRWRLQPPPKSSTKRRMLTGSGIRLGLIVVIPSLLTVKFVFFIFEVWRGVHHETKNNTCTCLHPGKFNIRYPKWTIFFSQKYLFLTASLRQISRFCMISIPKSIIFSWLRRVLR